MYAIELADLPKGKVKFDEEKGEESDKDEDDEDESEEETKPTPRRQMSERELHLRELVRQASLPRLSVPKPADVPPAVVASAIKDASPPSSPIAPAKNDEVESERSAPTSSQGKPSALARLKGLKGGTAPPKRVSLALDETQSTASEAYSTTSSSGFGEHSQRPTTIRGKILRTLEVPSSSKLVRFFSC